MLRLILACALAGCNACMAMQPADSTTVPALPGLPPPANAADAGAQVNHARNLVQGVLGVTATPEQLRRGAAEIEGLRALLDRQPYRDFSARGTQLYAERFNIDLALAEIRTRLGDKEAAPRALEPTTGVF